MGKKTNTQTHSDTDADNIVEEFTSPHPKPNLHCFRYTHTQQKKVPPSESVGLESHPLRHRILGINRVGGGAGQVFI